MMTHSQKHNANTNTARMALIDAITQFNTHHEPTGAEKQYLLNALDFLDKTPEWHTVSENGKLILSVMFHQSENLLAPDGKIIHSITITPLTHNEVGEQITALAEAKGYALNGSPQIIGFNSDFISDDEKDPQFSTPEYEIIYGVDVKSAPSQHIISEQDFLAHEDHDIPYDRAWQRIK